MPLRDQMKLKKKYKVIKKSVIYTGNSSCVYLGIVNNKECVIKSYYDKNSTEFTRETEILRKLSHLNIIKPSHIYKKSIITRFNGISLRAS